MYHHHTSTRLEDQCQQSEPTTCDAILISHFRSLLALVRGGASSVSPITGRPQTRPKASRERESTRTALPEQLFAIHPCWLPRSDCLYNMRLLCLLRRGRGRLPRRPLLDQQPLLYTHLDIIIAPVAGAGAFLPLPESLRRPEAQSRIISSTVQTCGSTRYQPIQCSRTSKR